MHDEGTGSGADSADEAICTLVTRLARPHASGGEVVERAAILAEGGDFSAVMAWIAARGGEPEPVASSGPGRGLHGSLIHDSRTAEPRSPLRFVLPAGALIRAASPPPAPPGEQPPE
jgi:hypothetical protein